MTTFKKIHFLPNRRKTEAEQLHMFHSIRLIVSKIQSEQRKDKKNTEKNELVTVYLYDCFQWIWYAIVDHRVDRNGNRIFR